jgi:integrase
MVRESSRRTDEGRLRTHIIPTFGAQPLRAITPIGVRTWVAGLSERRAPKTVRNCHGLLSKILADAVSEGLIGSNPCLGTPMPAASESIARFLSPAEIEALVTATPSHYKPLVVTAVSTGMRWGELAGLRPVDVDLERRQLQVAQTSQRSTAS